MDRKVRVRLRRWRIAVVACWIAAVAVGGIGWFRADSVLENRLTQRVATGIHAEATVTEVESFWFGLILDGRGPKVRRLTVEYEIGGLGYRSQLMWVEPADAPDLGRGGTIDVYADARERTLIATATGGGSDGWVLVTPRATFKAWVIVATVLSLVLLATGTRRITVAGQVSSRFGSEGGNDSTVRGSGNPESPSTVGTGSIPKAYRGYDVSQVDAAIEQVYAARGSGSDVLYRITCDQLAKTTFRTILYGYDRVRVHELMAELCSDVLATASATTASRTTFTVVIRGYDRVQVDALVKESEAALESNDPSARSAALEVLSAADFGIALRGYDRQQVGDWKDRMVGKLRQELPS
jgi:hypothetical protein